VFGHDLWSGCAEDVPEEKRVHGDHHLLVALMLPLHARRRARNGVKDEHVALSAFDCNVSYGTRTLEWVTVLGYFQAIVIGLLQGADWNRIIRGFLRTLRTRRIETPDERMVRALIAEHASAAGAISIVRFA
jgi:hypothetical protein